jgi:hypothetical protein
MAATSTGKAKAKKERTISALGRLRSGGVLVMIEERGPRSLHADHYLVTAIPADFGRAFLWEKFNGDDSEPYAVNVGDGSNSASCECRGYLHHGHCRHVDGSRQLMAEGSLPAGPELQAAHASACCPEDGGGIYLPVDSDW